MKALCILFVMALMFAPLALAGDIGNFFDDEIRGNVYGVQVDAPNIIKVNDNLFVGLEWTKDVGQEAWEGHTFLVKGTLPFTAFDFSKK